MKLDMPPNEYGKNNSVVQITKLLFRLDISISYKCSIIIIRTRIRITHLQSQCGPQAFTHIDSTTDLSYKYE